jgi:hypothetical protein
MTTTNHTSPSGEDAANLATGKPAGQSRGYTAQLERRVQELEAQLAANGAIGEREAPKSVAMHAKSLVPLLQSFADRLRNDERSAQMFEADWDLLQEAITLCRSVVRSRAALTAEKVAAEPVAVGWPHLAELHADAAYMFQRVRQGTLSPEDATAAVRSKIDAAQAQIAAPQQPAQSAEQAERSAFLSGRDVEELFLRWSEWTTELGEAISRKNIDGFVSDLRALLAAQPADGGKS